MELVSSDKTVRQKCTREEGTQNPIIKNAA